MKLSLRGALVTADRTSTDVSPSSGVPQAVRGRPTVSAVVLNWNGRKTVLQTIAALFRSDYPFEEIILVDNASTDGSVDAVREAFPRVIVLPQRHNLGLSEGRNVGIRRAVTSGVNYIFTVDNDIDIYPNTIGELVRVGEERPDVGIIGVIMYFKDDPTLIQNVGAHIRFRQNINLPIGWLHRDRGQFTQPIEVDMVGGGAMLTRREVFDQVGYFDAGYLGYGLEDTDFCMRVRLAGWLVVCNPRAKILHDFHINHHYTYHRKYCESRNAVLFLRKYGRPTDWAKFLFFALISLPYVFVREAFRHNIGGALGKAQGLFDALAGRENKAVRVSLSHD
jgi:GT2 family glycosyltransferase